VDSKAECDQLHLTHVARNEKYKKEKLKQINASAPLVQTGSRSVKSVQEAPGRLWTMELYVWYFFLCILFSS